MYPFQGAGSCDTFLEMLMGILKLKAFPSICLALICVLKAIPAIHETNALREALEQLVGIFLLKSIIALSFFSKYCHKTYLITN